MNPCDLFVQERRGSLLRALTQELEDLDHSDMASLLQLHTTDLEIAALGCWRINELKAMICLWDHKGV